MPRCCFLAAYRLDNGLVRLWSLKGVQLVTSAYALKEARINRENGVQRERLEELIKSVKLVEQLSGVPLPHGITLPEKDRPICKPQSRRRQLTY